MTRTGRSVCSWRRASARPATSTTGALAESQREYEQTGKRPRHGELKKQLVGLKQSECPWLYEVSAHIGQQALVDLERAFDRFFKSVKGEGPRSGFPRFKRKGERDSARLYEFQVFDRHVHLPMVGRVRLKECTVNLTGRPITATIGRRADRWFVSLTVEHEREIPSSRPIERPRDIVGVDLGLTNHAVIHDGASPRVIRPGRPLRKTWRSYDGSTDSSRGSRRDRGIGRRRSSVGLACTTGSAVSVRTRSISSRAHWREPSR